MVSPGIYRVEVEKAGYYSTYSDVSVPPEVTDLAIKLEPINTPPVVQITTPKDSEIIYGTVTITSQESTGELDIASTKFEYSKDGITWNGIGTDTNGADGWSTTWDTKSVLSNGAYQIKATMSDTGGLQGSATISVDIENLVLPPSPTGGLGVGISPMTTTVTAPATINYNVRIKSTENFDDIIRVYVSMDGLSSSYQMPLTWVGWTEKKVKLSASSETVIPLTLDIPSGTTGKKAFRVKTESILWTSKAQGTAIITIS